MMRQRRSWTIGVLLVLNACGSPASGIVDAGGEDAPASVDASSAIFETVIDSLGAPFALTVVDGSIFYSDVSDSTIKVCSATDCPATSAVYTTGQVVHIDALRAHGGWLYWASTQGVFRCPSSSCTKPERIASITNANAIAIDDTGVFIADQDAENIVFVAAGAPAVVIAADARDVRSLLVKDGFVYYPTYGLPPSTSHIYRCATTGCGLFPTRLDGTSIGIGAVGVAADDSFVYWTEASNTKRCPLDGCLGPAEEILSSSQSYERILLLDGWLYVGIYGPMVHVCSAAACLPTHSETEIGSIVQAMAHDDTHVYVLTSSGPGDGRIVRTLRRH